jgi:hypothetical protein
MPRFAAKVTPDELRAFIENEAKSKGLTDDDGFSMYEIQQLGRIGEDLSKVQFDFENCYYTENEEFSDRTKGLLGYRQIGDLSFLGVYAGGDWEMPVYFLIYLDQNKKTLRAYIPEDGNVWNFDTKQAIGNDEEADDKFLRKWIKKHRKDIELDDEMLESDDGDVMEDRDAMIKDITNRVICASIKKSPATSSAESVSFDISCPAKSSYAKIKIDRTSKGLTVSSGEDDLFHLKLNKTQIKSLKKVLDELAEQCDS